MERNEEEEEDHRVSLFNSISKSMYLYHIQIINIIMCNNSVNESEYPISVFFFSFLNVKIDFIFFKKKISHKN